MRFIHTSDWHLGKTLEGNSRLEEQEMFLNDFVDIVEQNDIDMVIIAGDIYDTSNPPAAAEKLFYKTAYHTPPIKHLLFIRNVQHWMLKYWGIEKGILTFCRMPLVIFSIPFFLFYH